MQTHKIKATNVVTRLRLSASRTDKANKMVTRLRLRSRTDTANRKSKLKSKESRVGGQSFV